MKIILLFIAFNHLSFGDDSTRVLTLDTRAEQLNAAQHQVWYRLNARTTNSFLLVAMEEGEWARKILKVGDWCPMNIFKIENSYVDIAISSIERKNSTTTLSYYLRNAKGTVSVAKTQYTDYGENGLPKVVVSQEKNALFVEIPYYYSGKDNSPPELAHKRLMIKFYDKKDDLEKISVSSLMISFEWKTAQIRAF